MAQYVTEMSRECHKVSRECRGVVTGCRGGCRRRQRCHGAVSRGCHGGVTEVSRGYLVLLHPRARGDTEERPEMSCAVAEESRRCHKVSQTCRKIVVEVSRSRCRGGVAEVSLGVAEVSWCVNRTSTQNNALTCTRLSVPSMERNWWLWVHVACSSNFQIVVFLLQ